MPWRRGKWTREGTFLGKKIRVLSLQGRCVVCVGVCVRGRGMYMYGVCVLCAHALMVSTSSSRVPSRVGRYCKLYLAIIA